MSIQFDKPFKTYLEQISIIKSKNVIVSNADLAENVLSSISYHTLINGYKNSFLGQNDDDFADGITFEDLYTMHIIDTNINNVIFKNILFFERSLKTKLSYVVARDFGVDSDFNNASISNSQGDYLSSCNYSGGNRKIPTLIDLKNLAIDCKPKDKILYHYKTNKNHIPPWILATKATLGTIIQWYQILKGPMKTEICNQLLPFSNCCLDDRKNMLNKSAELLRNFRNNCAHGNRTFSIDINNKIPKEIFMQIIPENVLNEGEYDSGEYDLFIVSLLIFTLLPDQYMRQNFIMDLNQILQPYKKYSIAGKSICNSFEIPDDYIDRAKKFSQLISN